MEILLIVASRLQAIDPKSRAGDWLQELDSIILNYNLASIIIIESSSHHALITEPVTTKQNCHTPPSTPLISHVIY